VSQGRSTTVRPGRGDLARTAGDAARKRAALEMIARYEPALKRTARRFSLDAEDADDAYQRALEIVLTKAPTTDARDLIRWTQTVTKHEALAVRQSREKLLGGSRSPGSYGVAPDPVAQIPAGGDGPDERAERNETIARSREALRSLKPAELRALSLLAEGYSYAEIGELTGFSQTKINRVLAEGRSRFRDMLSSSEDGSRCRELRPLLSAFCDGEASPRDADTVREHLRACAHCRATMRTYRAAPRIAVALAPAVPGARSLLERAHDLFAGIGSRLSGVGGSTDTAAQIAAAGGSRGAGMATLAKLLAICAGAGGAATCVATGVLPMPLLDRDPPAQAPIERAAETPGREIASEAVDYEPAPPRNPLHEARPERPPREGGHATTEAGGPTGAVEYESPPPAVEPAPPSGGESSAPSGSAAGEFGP
jgi:RNA polymerase sigma factor (sigma-70 family)